MKDVAQILFTAKFTFICKIPLHSTVNSIYLSRSSLDASLICIFIATKIDDCSLSTELIVDISASNKNNCLHFIQILNNDPGYRPFDFYKCLEKNRKHPVFKSSFLI